ncbi:MAG: FKBP-type peptidyl-prolyl cis-trans isomerase [Candidatus Hodarchaeota archaeon]
MMDPIAEGDFILADYIARVADESKLIFDLTDEETAKKENIWNEKEDYVPQLIVVGKGFMLKALEDQLIGMKAGESKTILLQPEDAFGKRDGKQIESMTVRRLQKIEKSDKSGKIQVGARVRIGNRIGTIIRMAGGRAWVDFNHPLAGKRIEYELHVREILEEQEQKMRYLLRRRIPKIDINRYEFEVEDENITIKVPLEINLAENLYFVKSGIALDLSSYMDFKKIYFLEEFDMTPPPEEPKEEESPTEETEKAFETEEEKKSSEETSSLPSEPDSSKLKDSKK